MGTNRQRLFKVIFIKMSTVKSLSEYGRKRANPEACHTNVLRLKECLCTDDPVCQDVITVTEPTGKFVTGVTIDGVSHVFDSPVDAGDSDAVWKAIYAVTYQYEANPTYVNVEADTDLVVTHIGATELGLLVDGAPVVAERCCELTRCKLYRTAIAIDFVGDLVVGDSTHTIDTTGLPLDDATAALLTAALNGDIAGCQEGSVTCDADSGEYIYDVYVPVGTDTPTIDKGGKEPNELTYCSRECEEVFLCSGEKSGKSSKEAADANKSLTALRKKVATK